MNISDAYVDAHPTWTLAKTARAAEKRLNEALRRAGIKIVSAITVAGIAPKSETGPLCVNEVYALHVHMMLSVSFSPDFCSFHEALELHSYQIHREAEAHSGTQKYEPTKDRMKETGIAGAICVKQCSEAAGGVHGLARYFDENVRAFRKNATQRGITMNKLGKELVHATADLRQAGQALFEREHKAIRRQQRMASAGSTAGVSIATP